MRILVTGAGGQLGSTLIGLLDDIPDCEAIGVDLPEFDLTDAETVRHAIRDAQPTAIVNTAAYTLVDRAEDEPDRCAAINDHAVATLAEACTEVDALLCQISTDYVFGDDPDRKEPYDEEDAVGPIGVYGRTKVASEQHAHRCKRHLIVRTCGLYGLPGVATAATNFVDKMVSLGGERDVLKVVNDQFCSPSYVPHVARAIAFLLQTDASGLYHVVNSDAATWNQFAKEIFRQKKMDVRVDAITTEEFGAPAPRPRYSVLDNSKYLALGGPSLPSWKVALAEYLAERSHVPPG